MGAPAGEEWMDADEAPRRRVALPRGLFVGRCPVTQREYKAVTGHNPAHLQGAGGAKPVECVSYDDALGLCRRLGRLTGRRCRLPTEAEWEYACRAGTATMYCSGDGLSALRQVGWCSYDGEWDGSGGTRKVGEMRANAWGLFDMHGNVWEWCSDWYAEGYYSAGPRESPTGPAAGSEKVVRGGSWRGGPWFCRSAERRGISPDSREINVGVRVVVEVG
jgi:formylglycine-generating enzyme required for sulfatase activity